MNIAERIINLFAGRKELTLADVPQDFCPNCWGRNEYGGAFYNAIKNKGINVNDIQAHVGWVQDYANKHLNDISLKSEAGEVVCEKCKVKYAKIS